MKKPVRKPKRKPDPLRKRGSQKQLNLATTRAILDLRKRVERLEQSSQRRQIGFVTAEASSEIASPDLDEIAETEIIG